MRAPDANCPRCHAAIEEETRTCRACGQPLPSENTPPALCKRCGVANSGAGRFCRNCGSPLRPVGVPLPAQPRPSPANATVLGPGHVRRSAAQHAPGSTVTQELKIIPVPPLRRRPAVGSETLAPGEHPTVGADTAAAASRAESQPAGESPERHPAASAPPPASPTRPAPRGPRAFALAAVLIAAATVAALGGALLWMGHRDAVTKSPVEAATPLPSVGARVAPSAEPSAGDRPALPLVLHGLCPGAGCRYDQWWAPTTMTVYVAPGEPNAAASALEAGEAFIAVEGELRAADPPTVRLGRTCTLRDSSRPDAAGVTIPQGELIWVLHPDADGRYFVWHRGAVRSIPDFWSRESAECQGQVVHQGTSAAWWVHVRDKRGRSGWVVNPTSRALLDPPEEPAFTVAVARTKPPVPAPTTDAVAIALAKARRAQQEGRLFAPAGNCSLSYVADVLAAAPQSADAKRWLDELGQSAIADATRAASQNRTEAGLAHLDEVILAAKARPELSAFQERLREKREWLYRATRVFEVGHDHGSKRVAWERVRPDLSQAGCSGSLELTESGFSFRTRESLDNRRDNVGVAASEVTEIELKDEDTRLRLKTTGHGSWSFVGSPDAMRRIYDHLRARSSLTER